MAAAVSVIDLLDLAARVGPWRHRFAGNAPLAPWRVVCFLAAPLLVYGAAGRPFEVLSDSDPLAVPPLVPAGTPAWVLRPVLRVRALRWAVAGLVPPVVAMIVFTVVFSLTDLPPVVEPTLTSEPAHFADHGLIIIAALAMWWPILSPMADLPPLPAAGQPVHLGLCLAATTVLFALVTLPKCRSIPHVPRRPASGAFRPLPTRVAAV